jgi:hypothetical protein
VGVCSSAPIEGGKAAVKAPRETVRDVMLFSSYPLLRHIQSMSLIGHQGMSASGP